MAAGSPRRPSRRRAIFVDRDGTLMPDLHYLANPDAVEIAQGVGDALRLLRLHGYLIICITNQSGVERGFFPEDVLPKVHSRINDRLAPYGARVDAFYYCPHLPERGCDCRKPGVALFRRAQDEWAIDFPASSIIGDRAADVEAGEKLGLLTVLIPEAGHEAEVTRELVARRLVPDLRLSTFGAAAAAVLARG